MQIIKGIAVSALTLGLLAGVQAASAAPLGIANTKHNLGTGGFTVNASGARVTTLGGIGDIFTTATSEICVFCHTPHGANTSVPVPLWNKGSLPSTSYTTYNSGTMNGVAPSNLAGHMSLACLSCHDGTQAMDNMINAPGSDGYNASGARFTNGIANPWNSAAGIGAPGDLVNGALSSGAGVFMLGTDLSNDHPIGMPYGGGGCATGAVATQSTTCNDKDFNNPQNGLVSPTGVQWFQVGSATAGDKTAMRLYNTSANTIATATVECASCHDPHSDAQNTFLRRTNTASGVCLTCHAK